jgi:Lrp/AsnC family transcriptional regulator for asnA, asnC and gidA
MKPKIDEVDRAILECLHEDARMPCTEIARRLGNMTARGISDRLNRLICEGFVEINAGAIPEQLGYVISADLFVEVEPGMIRKVADNLCKLDEVIYVALSLGETDISVTVVADSMESLQTFIADIIHSIHGVRKTRTYILTKVLKVSCDWNFPKNLPQS